LGLLGQSQERISLPAAGDRRQKKKATVGMCGLQLRHESQTLGFS
jgi:hypothetical protein